MIDLLLIIFLLVTAIAAVFARNLVVASIFFSVFSLIMALLYLSLAAPDVAMTEAAVGAAFSTVLLLAAIRITGANEQYSKHRPSAIIVILLSLAVAIFMLKDAPKFGDQKSPSQRHVARYYITQSEKDTGIPNMVTSVLASYRGFDTLGEVTVIFTAMLSVVLLLSNQEVVKKTASRKKRRRSA